jgi:hypothetical protein
MRWQVHFELPDEDIQGMEVAFVVCDRYRETLDLAAHSRELTSPTMATIPTTTLLSTLIQSFLS